MTWKVLGLLAKSPLFSVTAEGQLLRGLLAPTSVSLNVLFLWPPRQLARDMVSQDTQVDTSGCNEVHC